MIPSGTVLAMLSFISPCGRATATSLPSGRSEDQQLDQMQMQKQLLLRQREHRQPFS